jgi:hypothetical protein
MMDSHTTPRLLLIQQYTQTDAAQIAPLLEDCHTRATAIHHFALQHFSPLLQPATVWVSPLHPPVNPEHDQ